MNTLKSILQKKSTILVLGLLLGVLVMASIRIATFKVVSTHHHANFALYINGEREEFKDKTYYQETAVCKVGHEITAPTERTHMHSENNGLVHIHDHAVTWGNFFENIGWSVSSDSIITNRGVRYLGDDTNKLNIRINGQDYTDLTSIANLVIKDLDRLLISYGDISNDQIQEEMQTIPDDAEKANNSKDPSACAGREAIPFSERLRHIF